MGKIAETLRAATLILLLVSLVSCAVAEQQITSRDVAVQELSSLVAHEHRRDQVKAAVRYLGVVGFLDVASGPARDQIKRSFDIEYIFYHAALVSLAGGKVGEYHRYVRLADEELDIVLHILHEVLDFRPFLNLPGSLE